MEKTIYNLQKFLILQTKINPQTANKIPDSYAYAWYHDCYPMFDSADFHEDLEKHFIITKDQVDMISNYADSEWLQKRYYTFYQYEDKFQVRHGNAAGIERSTLLSVFRYMYLRNMFDKPFWDALLTPMEYPTEASGVTRNFDIDDIYFV